MTATVTKLRKFEIRSNHRDARYFSTWQKRNGEAERSSMRQERISALFGSALLCLQFCLQSTSWRVDRARSERLTWDSCHAHLSQERRSRGISALRAGYASRLAPRLYVEWAAQYQDDALMDDHGIWTIAHWVVFSAERGVMSPRRFEAGRMNTFQQGSNPPYLTRPPGKLAREVLRLAL
jgi:hypothetical protein